MYQDNFLRELIIDNFAGGGGASTGIELALGRPVDIAVNHDGDAIAMHRVNHPYTQHFQEDVFAIDPETVTGGRPVGLAWFSPDCKHFSRAKGGKPVEKKIRGLSWVVLKWAMSSVAPRVIFMENVSEIQTWGPLKADENGNLRPDPDHMGETFNGFVAMLTTGISSEHPALIEACEFLKIDSASAEAARLVKGLGYKVKYRELKACDYGAPTIRKRFYLIARNDGKPIVFPQPTHGESKGLLPYHTAAECIDWSIPCPSIFERKKPLVDNTLRRIARGLDKFTIRNLKPFIVPIGYGEHAGQKPRVNSIDDPVSTVVSTCKQNLVMPHLTKYFSGKQQSGAAADSPTPTVTAIDHNGLVAASLVQYHSEQSEKEVRGQQLDDPIMTVDGSPRYGLSTAHLVQYYGGSEHYAQAEKPLQTVVTKPRHFLVENHLCVLRKNMDCKPATEPVPTITAGAGHLCQISTYLMKADDAQDLGHWAEVRELLNKYAGYDIKDDEVLIIEIDGVAYFIADIGMRMLKAEELKLAQGFPKDYVIDIEGAIGKPYSEAKQIARLGNAVCPPVAKALILANCADMALTEPIDTMAAVEEAYTRGSMPKKRVA